MSMTMFINLLNLLPINPLDGGRIVKALICSFKESWAFVAMIFSFVAGVALSLSLGFGLLFLIALAGLFEVVHDYGLEKRLERLTSTLLRLVGSGVLYVFGLTVFELASGRVPIGLFPWLVTLFIILGGLAVLSLLVRDVYRLTLRWETKGTVYMSLNPVCVLLYPWIVLKHALSGVQELCSLTHKDLVRIDAHEQMNRRQLMFYAVAYVLIFVAHVSLVVYAANISEFGLAAELLK